MLEKVEGPGEDGFKLAVYVRKQQVPSLREKEGIRTDKESNWTQDRNYIQLNGLGLEMFVRLAYNPRTDKEVLNKIMKTVEEAVAPYRGTNEIMRVPPRYFSPSSDPFAETAQ